MERSLVSHDPGNGRDRRTIFLVAGFLLVAHEIRPAVVHAPNNSDAIRGGLGNVRKLIHSTTPYVS
jgi:hypothetical protein